MPTILLITLTIIGWAVGSVFYKLANDRIDPVMCSAIGIAAYILLVPLTFLFLKVSTALNTMGVVYALLGALTMGLGSLTYYYLLQRGGVGTISAATSVYPALILLISVLFLGEELNVRKVIGVALALGSVWILSS